ncbi:MAG: NADH-quinone oxidoreductase subunit NuoH [Armatimonadota bacterium]|nr:NADH-quinone oxidoreductase subunit NuoH [Armatimonadota bacterium]
MNLLALSIPETSIFWPILRVAIILGFILAIVPGIIYWERKLLAWFQDRVGPNRVGPFGLLQTIADGIKLFLKEDVNPANVDKFIYVIAPAVALLPAFAIWGTIPWGPNPLLTPIADVDIGILYVLAVSSMGVYGVFLAGWASNNKYSLLGGLRSAAQMISYELAMGVALGCVILATGSLRITEVVKAQHGPLWGSVDWLQNWFILTPYGFVAGVIFFICMVAETNRAPFDLPEAESELIAGFHTEYSSMKFAVFFMGEYASIMAFCGLFAAMFLGGWSPLPLNWEYLAQQNIPVLSAVSGVMGSALLAPVWFIGKLALGISVFIWIRATLPRLRYDQLMTLGWKYLLPLAAVNFVVVAIYMQFGWIALAGAVAVLALLYVAIVATMRQKPEDRRRAIELVK